MHALATVSAHGFLSSLDKIKLDEIANNVKTYGATGDGSTNDFLNIQTAFATENDLEYPLGTYRISTSGTIGGAVTHRFIRGAKLHIDTGVTLTIAGAIDAMEDQQIFELAGTGKVLLSTETIVHPEWWGAKADGVTDDGTALNQSTSSFVPGAGGQILLRGRTYYSTVEWQPESNTNIEGVGDITVIKSASPHLIRYIGKTHCSVRWLKVDGVDTAHARIGISTDQGASYIKIHNISTVNTAQYGIATLDGTGFSTTVTGAADNGSGLIRLQVTTTAGLVSGNLLGVYGVLGTIEANFGWTIDVIDATHVDLRNSKFTNAWTPGPGQIVFQIFGGAGGNEIVRCHVDMTGLDPLNAPIFTCIGIEIFPHGGQGFLATPGILIDSNTLIGTLGGLVTGIKMSSQLGARITHNHIENVTCFNPPGEGAIDIGTSTDVVIDGNTIYQTKHGISVTGAGSGRDTGLRNRNITISNNIIRLYADVGILSLDGYEGLVIKGNQIDVDIGVGQFAMYLSTLTKGYERVLIEGNNLIGGGITIGDVTVSGFNPMHVTARNNTVKFAPGTALSVDGDFASVTGNMILHPEGAGLTMLGDASMASHNTIVNPNSGNAGRDAIEVSGANIKLFENHIENRTSDELSLTIIGAGQLGTEIYVQVSDADWLLLQAGMFIVVSGVAGALAADLNNGGSQGSDWRIIPYVTGKIRLINSTWNGHAWTSGGIVSFKGRAAHGIKTNNSNRLQRANNTFVNMLTSEILWGSPTLFAPRPQEGFSDVLTVVTTVADGAEHDLKSIVFPGGRLGPAGKLRVVGTGVAAGSATSTLKMYFGDPATGVVLTQTLNAGDDWIVKAELWCTGGEGSLIGLFEFYSGGRLIGTDVKTVAVNTSAPYTIKFTGQSATDTINQTLFTGEVEG